MRNLKLTLSYDGTDFHGWQVQPNKRTVQQVVEEAITEVTGEQLRVNASGRTDSGVHAVGQVVNFRISSSIPTTGLLRAINANLPHDVAILSSEDKPESFDANRDAVRKLYRYVIFDGERVSPFLRRYCCHSRHRLDAEKMRQAAELLLGRHDFRCFETEWPNRATSVRTITHLSINRFGEYIWLDVEADGFLYNMVRTIAGTLMYVGRGYWPVAQVADIVEAGDRTQAGPTAAASGLFLMRVTYDD